MKKKISSFDEGLFDEIWGSQKKLFCTDEEERKLDVKTVEKVIFLNVLIRVM
jgi:hypothetical protein